MRNSGWNTGSGWMTSFKCHMAPSGAAGVFAPVVGCATDDDDDRITT